MQNQTRRAFLTSVLAAAGVVAIGPVPKALELPLAQSFYDEWIAAFAKVFADFQADVFIFGVGAMEYCEVFPFVRTVDPSDIRFSFIPNDKIFKGLLND